MRRRVVGRIGLALGSLVVALLVAELALRLLGIAPARYAAPVALESPDKRWAIDLYPDDPRAAFPLDLRDDATRATWVRRIPEIAEHAARLPHGVGSRYSPQLCRGEVPDAPPRVVVVGDSFTEGQGVPEDAIFAARLTDSLGVPVIACGRRGLDFPGLSERFDQVVDALAPDVVLYAMVLNDPVRSEAFHARQRFVDDWIVDRRRMVAEGDGSPPPWPPRLVQLVQDRVEGARIGAATERWYQDMVLGDGNAAGWRETVERIARMDARMEGRFVVAIFPLLVGLDDYPFRDVHRAIVDALEAREITVVDALPAFEGADETTLWVHPADRHPNAEGHRRFADAVAPALRALVRR